MYAEQQTLSGYSEQWAEYHEWLDAYETLAALARRARIHVSDWVWGEFVYPTGLEMPRLTSLVGNHFPGDYFRHEPRYWEFMTRFPMARSVRPAFFEQQDPSTGAGVGDPLPPLRRQFDSQTRTWHDDPPYMFGMSEDIDAKINRVKRLANTVRGALDNWMWQNGINSNVMNMKELGEYVDYVNAAAEGDQGAYIMLQAAAPEAPQITTPAWQQPPAADPQFFTLQNFSLQRSWPGLVAGAVAGMLFR